jgi:crotonobetainyl-CoA:carnitine CoA-transferase CaiB-like acyl-CoA transferase
MIDNRHVTPSGRVFIASPAKFYRWTVLPYGCWVCEDGREVLFNRFYEPIWQRRGGNAEPADCHERVGHARQSWFYTDADERAKRTKAIAGLAAWGATRSPATDKVAADAARGVIARPRE